MHLLPILLSEANSFLHLADRFRAGASPVDLRSFATVSLLAASIVLALWLGARWLSGRGRSATNDPWRMLAELCRAQGLNHAQQRLVKRIARAVNPEQPAMVLVDPNILEQMLRATTNKRSRRELARLQALLFASSETETAAPGLARR